MNSLDIGTCVLTCDGVTLTCGDVTIPASTLAAVDGRVVIDLPNLHVVLLAEEWDALLGVKSAAQEVAEIAAVAEEVTAPVAVPAPSKRGRRS